MTEQRRPEHDPADQPALTYADVGGTRDAVLPEGYRHQERREVVGHGPTAFERVAAGLMGWDVQRGAGVRVDPTTPRAAVGVEVVGLLGPGRLAVRIPCRVVWTVDDDRRCGFAYGTLPGHPEIGEESFVVDIADDESVSFGIRAFSRPGSWYTRLGGPVANLAQDVAGRRYVAAARRIAAGG